MKEKSRLFILLGVVALIVLVVIIGGNNDNNALASSGNSSNYINELNYEEYESLLNSDKAEIFTVVQTGCGFCTKQEAVFEEIYKNYGYKSNTIDIRKLESDDLQSFYSSLSYYNENEWGTPLTLVVKDNEVIAQLGGYTEYEAFVEFLINNGFLGEHNE